MQKMTQKNQKNYYAQEKIWHKLGTRAFWEKLKNLINHCKIQLWRDDRVVEGARLEI